VDGGCNLGIEKQQRIHIGGRLSRSLTGGSN
jgi:hypothetical protein